MKKLAPKTKLLLGSLLFLLISVPVIISLVQQQQDTRSRAAGSASTIVSLIPDPGPDSHIAKNVGDTVQVNVMVDPGNNTVHILRMQVKYNPTYLQPVEPYYKKFEPDGTNPQSLSRIIDFPTPTNNGLVSVTVSSGTDTVTAISGSEKKVGTFFFKTLAATPEDTPAVVEFTSNTKAFSQGTGDQAYVDVLEDTNPAEISIGQGAPTTTGTTLSFFLLLHGIGAAGDTPNPTGNIGSNKTPKTPQRNLLVEIFNANNELVTSQTGTLEYLSGDEHENNKGKFTTNVTFPDLETGNYTVKIKSDRYLRKAFPGIISITKGQPKVMPTIELVAGDTNNDNALDIEDYNALLDCGYASVNPLPNTNAGSPYNSYACKTHEPRINIDLDDNGIVNSFDYNLYLRELSVQSGD